MHTCSHFGARVRRSDMMRETVRAQQQVPQHFDGALANESHSLALHRMALTRERKNLS